MSADADLRRGAQLTPARVEVELGGRLGIAARRPIGFEPPPFSRKHRAFAWRELFHPLNAGATSKKPGIAKKRANKAQIGVNTRRERDEACCVVEENVNPFNLGQEA